MMKQEEVLYICSDFTLPHVTAAGEQNTGLTWTVGLMQFRPYYVKYFKKSEYFKL